VLHKSDLKAQHAGCKLFLDQSIYGYVLKQLNFTYAHVLSTERIERRRREGVTDRHRLREGDTERKINITI